ncbi:unnamed protein product [Didymodactylos carnosus]|uniref:Uncharacterized protein n=2 Tax=Didymodactylos carnosus TaxID=1234261 RepID=A0A8S2IH16_9BILA|nr:unnamed protein product [Didymodactylos carnosus]CAF3739625.1 unnamed protein product [Didymodactylos carnosus]
MPQEEVGNLWVNVMDEFQNIERINQFYDYVTSTWIDDDALFHISLWNYFNFKSLRTNNNLEDRHYRLNNDLNHINHPHFYVFIRAIQNDYAHNAATLSRHLATGTLPPRKKLYVNRNARLLNLEDRYQAHTLTLEEYFDKVSRLVGVKKF